MPREVHGLGHKLAFAVMVVAVLAAVYLAALVQH